MNPNIIAWILTISSVLIIGTNLLIAAALLLLIQKKGSMNWYFVLNLAVADILVGIGITGIATELFNAHASMTHKTGCLLRMACVTSPCAASILTMFLIAFDRYLAIKLPLRYINIMTTRTLAACLSGLWLFSFLVGFLPVMVKDLQNEQHYDGFCALFLVVRPKDMIIVFCVAFFPVFLVFIFFYCDILKIAYSHERQIRVAQRASSHRTQTGHYTRDMKALRTVAILVGCFTISWTPFFMTSVVQAFCEGCHLYQVIENYLWLIGLSNSLLNPLVYAYWQLEVREQVGIMFAQMRVRIFPASATIARVFSVAHIPTENNQREAVPAV
ncbi:glucose-dependent insulinotropic receptor-like [Acipenser ruthenus]|uniref:glucose-dependent insulinotropic receptor-like n=1 Tax=Acipenser ruthenus TaxID=7906 RepID=UPI00155FCF4A|nr:glucose-dependent insulinotropic receptor-like [Acipenser ruthenus]